MSLESGSGIVGRLTKRNPGCPFCGSHEKHEVRKGDVCHFWVRCVNCLAEGPAMETSKQAITAWFKRAAIRAEQGGR